MTTEEAIKALRLMEHVESISTIYEPGEVRNDTTVRELKEACSIAISALRAPQAPVKLDRSLWKGCSECTASYNREDWKSGVVHEFRIDEDSLFFFDSQRGWEGIKIKFCPVCGKPLTAQAWAELEQRIGGNNGETDQNHSN